MMPSKVVVFTCNWDAYSAMDMAGTKHNPYPASVRPIRLTCLGQVHPGIILKALEKGASGVLLLGCAPGECHYEFGNQQAEKAFAEARGLASLLGYRDEQLQMDWIAAGQGETFAEKVRQFVCRLDGMPGVPEAFTILDEMRS
jgi:F420-non-reducing hydrogenase iron-sulfur subunit